jgi:hypothetical protein
MGSDLYMEQRNFHPRPARVTWTSATEILIETDVFYYGYREFYHGKPTPEIKQVMKSMGIKLPPKPKPRAFNVDNINDNYLKWMILFLAEAKANRCDCSPGEGHDVNPPCATVKLAKELRQSWTVLGNVGKR